MLLGDEERGHLPKVGQAADGRRRGVCVCVCACGCRRFLALVLAALVLLVSPFLQRPDRDLLRKITLQNEGDIGLDEILMQGLAGIA